MRIGLIADTHGFVGDDVLAALDGADHILHAGDVGEGVLAQLSGVAGVTAVRGNNDAEGEASRLPEVAFVDMAGYRIAVVHRLIDAPAPPWDLLVFGHCHKMHDYSIDGRRYVNPGAAGRRGFHRTRSMAVLHLEQGRPRVEFVELGLRAAGPRTASSTSAMLV